MVSIARRFENSRQVPDHAALIDQASNFMPVARSEIELTTQSLTLGAAMPKLYPIALFEGAPGLSIRHGVRGPPSRGIRFLAQPSWFYRSVPEGGAPRAHADPTPHGSPFGGEWVQCSTARCGFSGPAVDRWRLRRSSRLRGRHVSRKLHKNPHPTRNSAGLQSTPWWAPRILPPRGAPNVVLIITDDAGFGAARPGIGTRATAVQPRAALSARQQAGANGGEAAMGSQGRLDCKAGGCQDERAFGSVLIESGR